MLTTILKQLRYPITALSLFAGIASAQAAMTINFEQDDNTGLLTISFGGQQTVPFDMPFTTSSNNVSFTQTGINVWTSGGFWSAIVRGWSLQGTLPWTAVYDTPQSISGTGGFAHDASLDVTQVFSTTNTLGRLTWDGEISYLGNLAGIGLSDGQTGSFALVNGTDTISINWSAVVIPVPEPATYALVLGLGVAGVAMLRRRARG